MQPRPGLPRDERGQSLSAFVALVMVALLLGAGLVVDGGAQSAASRRAEQAAAQAARAALDATAPTRAAGVAPDVAAAVRAGEDALGAAGVSGSVRVTAGRVRVETQTSVPTVVLSLIGVRTLSARGSAEADLRTP